MRSLEEIEADATAPKCGECDGSGRCQFDDGAQVDEFPCEGCAAQRERSKDDITDLLAEVRRLRAAEADVAACLVWLDERVAKAVGMRNVPAHVKNIETERIAANILRSGAWRKDQQR